MKTPIRLLVGLAVLSGLCACTPPEDEVHPKKRSSRTDNLKRYVPKAQELRALAVARSKPVVEGSLVDTDVLKEFVSKPSAERISAAVSAQRDALQNAVREAASRRAAQKVSALAARFEEDASSAVQNAQTPAEMALRLDKLKKQLSDALAQLGEEEKARGWERADAEQSRLSRKDLQTVFRTLSQDIEKEYGAVCAKKIQPVLRKAADDYWLALSSVKTREDRDVEFARVGKEADAAFVRTVEQFGDPALSFSADDLSALKTRAISAHQKVETQFEKLYGKEAVLQARVLFERYLNGLEKLASEPGRLAELSERLEALNASYREDVTSLQVKLNGELEQKLLAARMVRP